MGKVGSRIAMPWCPPASASATPTGQTSLAPLRAETISAAVLGGADGTTSIGGVIAGGAAASIDHRQLAQAAIGGALAATVSMAGAQWLSEGDTQWGAVGAMAIGTFLGSALPAVPLLFLGGPLVWACVAVVAVLVGIVVGEVRYRTMGKPRAKAWAQTLFVLTVGVLMGVAAGLT